MAATLWLVPALGGQRRLVDFRSCLLIAVAVAMATASAAATAATFGPVRYDPNGDQLVVSMIYDGTKPNHHFSIHWDTCRKDDQPVRQTIGVNILDDDYNDAATTTYTETMTVPLATLSCRPATVVLWTPPRSTTSVDIPARP
jgi:hypothetical protein